MSYRAIILKIIVAVALLCAAGPSFAEAPADLRKNVLAAFLALNDGPNTEARAVIVGTLNDAAVTEADWREMIKAHYETAACSAAHVALWDEALKSTAGEAQRRTALVAAMWAAGAMAKGMPSAETPQGLEGTFARGLDLLILLNEGLGPDGRAKALQYLADFFGEAGAAPLGAQDDAKSQHAYMQLGLTVRGYAAASNAGPGPVGPIMGLQGAARAFWDAHAIFLFDPGLLNAQQVAILNGLAGAIPKELHNIGAFIVSGTANVGMQDLVPTAQVVFIDPIALSVRVNPNEFYSGLGPADAPVFAVAAAQGIIAAVQAVQFERRPELELRRDIILYRSSRRKERYLRRYDMVAPASYHADPASFLPSIAYLWMMDSVRTFGMAAELFDIDLREAMDSYLLFADMMSGGGNYTYVYIMAPDGSISRDSAAISRIHVTNLRQWLVGISGILPRYYPSDMFVCNGIIIADWRYWFDLDELGSTVRKFNDLNR